MDAFNYLSVMVSIVVGLGLTQLIGGIGNLAQIRRRVQRYWLHTLWVLLLMVLHIHLWWSFWALRTHTDWNYGTFAYVLIGPAALVIASHIIIPELHTDRIDLERHYYDTSPLFFGTLALAGAWSMSVEPVMDLRPLLVPSRALQAIGVLTLIGCAMSKNKRFHAAAIAVIVALVGVLTALTRFRLAQFPVPGP